MNRNDGTNRLLRELEFYGYIDDQQLALLQKAIRIENTSCKCLVHHKKETGKDAEFYTFTIEIIAKISKE